MKVVEASNPLSNSQTPTWMERMMARTREALRRMNLVGRGAGSLRGWMAATLFAILVVGGISFARLAREQAAKSGVTAASAATTAKTPTTTAAAPTTTAANSNPIPAKAAGKSGKPHVKKAVVAAKQEAKAVEPVRVEAGKLPGTPVPAKQLVLGPPAMPAAAGQQDEENPDIGRERANWFFDQRAYPNKHIPEGALQKALEDRDAMKQRQRAAAGLKAGPNGIISFPGDALWHLMGPQPINEPFSVNSGFPTASGRVTAIAVDPTDATGNIVYIGAAAGGVWKTTDGGSTWTPLTDTQPSLAVGSIAIDPNSCLPVPCKTIYVGTGEENFNGDAYYGAGILKSTDGGTTWSQIGAPTFAQVLGPQTGGALIGQLAVQPGNPNIVLAAVSFYVNGTIGGIYRSTDAGVTWTEDAAPQGLAATSVVFESTSKGGTTTVTAWMAMGDPFTQPVNGIYKSTDSGLTWTKQTGTGANVLPIANLGRITLGYAPSTAGATATVYAAIADGTVNVNSSTLLGIFKTVDGGTNWTSVTGPTPGFCNSQCFYDMAVGVNPSNASFVVLGGGAFNNNSSTVFKSTNGGSTWTDITVGSTNVRPHVDTHAFGFNTSGGRLFVGNDGGMWRTDNPGTTPPLWVNLNAGSTPGQGLAITQFYPGPSAGISDENYGFGGTQDNDTDVFSGTLDWTNVFACGDGGFTAIDSNTPTTVYTTCDKLAAHVVQQSVFNGAVLAGPNPTFMPADIGITRETMQFIPPLIIYDNNPNILVFGTCRIWAAVDAATSLTPTWNAVSGDLSQSSAPTTMPCNTLSGNAGSITTMDIGHSNGNVVLAGTSNGKVWETINGGASWSEIDNLVPGQLPPRHVTAVRTKRDNATGQIAYVTFSGFGACSGCGATPGHIFKTINGGTTWTNISSDLPDIPVNDLIVEHHSNPTNFDALYIATDVGVFSCPDPEAVTPCQNWTVIGDGLPNSPVLGLAMRRSSHILRAATHGRSMWQIQLTDEGAPALAFMSSVTPAAVMAGAATTAVTVTGVNFSASTQVQFNFATTGVTTTFVNTTQLNVTLNSSLLQLGGVFPITLADTAGVDPGSAPGTGGLPFAVMNPILNPLTMTPISALTYTPVHFRLTGTNFAPGTVLAFYDTSTTPILQFQLQGGTPSSGGTVFDLTTVISQFTTPFTYNVIPFNPTPGGGINPADLIINGGVVPFTFTVTANPNPLAIVNPNPILLTAPLGSTSAVLTVSITNFGGAALNITAQSITGTNLANFSFAAPSGGTSCNFPPSGQSGLGTITLAAGGGTCNFGITYFAHPTIPGNANSVATLNLTDNGSGNPQAIPITGVPTASVVLFPVNFGTVGIGGTSATMNTTLFNASSSTVTVSVPGFTIGGTNPADFHIVTFVANGDGFSGCPTTLPFALTSFSGCDVSLNFTPSIAGNESATIQVTDDATGSPHKAALIGVGVQITSISPSIVATGGPAFTLTVNGGGFAPSAVVNMNGSARLTTFVSATQLLASIPASDIATAGSLAISVTTPVPGGIQSEPKTLIVGQAPSATNDNINFATNAGATPFRISQDTTHATTQLTAITTPANMASPADPTPGCAPSSRAKSVWFLYQAPGNGRVVADTRFSTYATNLSVWTVSPALPNSTSAFTAIACASGNVPGTPVESLVGFAVTSGQKYYLMVADASGTGLGGTLTFSLDFSNTVPANDPSASATNVAATPFTNTVNTIQATANTGVADPTPPCTVGAPGLALSGQANSVWYKFTAPNNGTITADTLTSPYDTILNVTSGTAAGTQVACNNDAGTGIAQSQVSFAATNGTTYFFMVSAFLGDGGTTNFHLAFAVGAAGVPATITATSGTPQSATISTAFAAPLVATVRDSGSSPVSGVVVTFTGPASGASGTFAGGVNTATTNGSGVATSATFTANATAGGPYTVSASVTGVATPANFSLTNNAGAAASITATSGTPQSATINTAFAAPLVATVKDAGSNPVSGVMVTFNAPASVASGTFAGGVKTATTNASGVATSAVFTANATAGAYKVTATVAGVATPASFALTNTPGPPASIATTAGTPQSATLSTAFATQLQATVKDAGGNVVSGAIVTFMAPAAGASGAFAGGVNTATTNASGVATAAVFTANATAGGPYTVAATVAGVATPANFSLTNNNPVPVITPPLAPTSAIAGGAAFPLTITGTKFVAGATVTFGSNPALTPTSITPTQVVVTIPAADFTAGGTPNVTVINPGPGGGPSNTVPFTVNNPAPTLTNATVAGKTHAAGGAALTLVLTGTNFVSTSVVNFGSNADTGGTVSNGRNTLTITIPASQVSTAGSVNITVNNPAPGGGTSTPAFAFAVDGFAVSGPANTPIKAGQTAMITIAVTPTANGFPNTVSFAVTGLPMHTTATFSPLTVTPNGAATTTTLTVVTKARGALPPAAPVEPPVSPLLRLMPIIWLAAMLAGMYAMRLARRTPQRRRYAGVVPLLLLLVTGAVLAGCAGSNNGTPAGTAQLSITATSGTMSVTTVANSVTLTVQ